MDKDFKLYLDKRGFKMEKLGELFLIFIFSIFFIFDDIFTASSNVGLDFAKKHTFLFFMPTIIIWLIFIISYVFSSFYWLGIYDKYDLSSKKVDGVFRIKILKRRLVSFCLKIIILFTLIKPCLMMIIYPFNHSFLDYMSSSFTGLIFVFFLMLPFMFIFSLYLHFYDIIFKIFFKKILDELKSNKEVD
jgi:hypothetical protein